mmetsp:Transcript_19484/g.62094  ORF Transcript_19484/g.62094 Transcript_19484/m.62094 type:complete len:217 (-) Transcript_19484:225-875(-)
MLIQPATVVSLSLAIVALLSSDMVASLSLPALGRPAANGCPAADGSLRTAPASPAVAEAAAGPVAAPDGETDALRLRGAPLAAPLRLPASLPSASPRKEKPRSRTASSSPRPRVVALVFRWCQPTQSGSKAPSLAASPPPSRTSLRWSASQRRPSLGSVAARSSLPGQRARCGRRARSRARRASSLGTPLSCATRASNSTPQCPQCWQKTEPLSLR